MYNFLYIHKLPELFMNRRELWAVENSVCCKFRDGSRWEWHASFGHADSSWCIRSCTAKSKPRIHCTSKHHASARYARKIRGQKLCPWRGTLFVEGEAWILCVTVRGHFWEERRGESVITRPKRKYLKCKALEIVGNEECLSKSGSNAASKNRITETRKHCFAVMILSNRPFSTQRPWASPNDT